jgi:hypothetical protein
MKPFVTHLWRLAAVATLSWVPVSHAELVHRYSFNGNANDSVGNAHGVARQTSTGGTLNGVPVDFTTAPGAAILDGAGAYIDLPNGIISAHTNLTIEMWVGWPHAGGNWQRVFDFGVASAGEDVDGSLALGNGVDYLFFAPAAGGVGALPRFAARDGDSGTTERPVLGSSTFLGIADLANPASYSHVVVVYTTNVARVFIDGNQSAIGATEIPLSAINDVNNFLGRSQYGSDALFMGAFSEVRIHNHPLTAPQVKASYFSGNPDALTYDAGTLSSLTMTATTAMLAGETQLPIIEGDYSGVGVVGLAAADLTLTTSNPDAVSITKDGRLKAEGAGSSTITASLSGRTATVTISVQANPPQLMNRYSFSEAQGQTTIIDSVGSQNGTVILGTNPPVQNGASLTLNGANSYANASYIDLPDGIISSRANASLEFWFTWNGANSETWTRLFDIGSSTKADGYATNSGNGTSAWWFSPVRGGTIYGMNVWNGQSEVNVNGTVPLPAGQQHHLVSIYAPNNQTSKLYLNGRLIASGGTPFELNTLNDVNVWLGAANWNDPPFRGSFNEFRIWEGEMSDLDIALSAKAGPDALPPATPGSLLSVSLAPIAPTFIGNLGGAQAAFTGNFQNVSGVDISGLSGVTYTSSNTDVFTVTAAGAVTPRDIGTANLIASYRGQSATTSVSILAPIAIRQDGFATNLISGSLSFVAPLRADYNGTNNVNATTFGGVTRTSSDPGIVTINNAGLVSPRKTGTAVVTAVYRWVQAGVTNSLTNHATVTVAAPPGFTKGSLVHRYSFSETSGDVFNDSVGTAHGTIRNATGTDFVGGQLALTGTTSTYGDLPNGIISSLTSVSIETWVTWNGDAGSSWQRIFDFGRSTAVDENGVPIEDSPGTGYGYMFLTPRSGDNTLRFAIKEATGPEVPQLNTTALTVGAKTHIAVVYDTVQKVARLYVNGTQIANAAVTHPLTVVEDINVWLGRAQWNDPFFNGSYDEFRIYNGPLLDDDIAANFAAGPDTIGAGPAPSVTISRVGSNLEITWPESATGYSLQSASQVNGTYAPAAVTPTTAGGVVKATIPVPTGATNAFFQLKK